MPRTIRFFRFLGLVVIAILWFGSCQDPNDIISYQHKNKFDYGKNLSPQQKQLFTAAEEGDLNSLRKLIHEKVDVNIADEYGDTVIMSAALWGNNEMLKLFLQAGADITKINLANQNVLHTAAQANHAANLALILEHAQKKIKDKKQYQAWLNQQDNTGNTALHWSVNEKNLEQVKLLLNAGIDRSLLNQEKETALRMAELLHQDTIAKILK